MRRRPAPADGRPAPEVIAVVLVAIIYGGALLVGLPAVVGGIGATTPSAVPTPSASPIAPSPTPDPRRTDILATIQVNQRLIDERIALLGLLEADPVRGSEIATVMRRINATAPLGADRVIRLSADPATETAASQLELIYANAGVITDRALDMAISSDSAYREAAEEIVDLFADLADINIALEAVLAPSPAPSEAPSESASAEPPESASPEPTDEAPASPSASAETSPGAVPSPSGGASPPPTRSPREILVNPGFDSGLAPWTLQLRSGVEASTQGAPPLVELGSASLQVDIAAIDAVQNGARVVQRGVTLDGGRRYLARVFARSTVERTLRLRVVGENQEIYGATVATIGPAVSLVELRFSSLATDTSATFSIDLAGPRPGTVWLDEASLAPSGD